MIVTAIIETFQQEIVEPLIVAIIEKIDADFRINKDLLVENLDKSFQPFLVNLLKQQQEQQASVTVFLQFSWLKSEYLFNNTMTYEVHSYDENWYYSPKQYGETFSFDWLLPYFNEFKNQLATSIIEHGNRSLAGQEDYYLKAYFDVFQQYFIALVRYLFKKKAKDICKQLIMKANFFVYVGEYKDYAERVYEWHQRPVISQNEAAYLFKDKENNYEEIKYYRSLDLVKINFENQCITWADFKNCDLKMANFEEALLVGTSFTMCNLDAANFQRSYIQDCDFRFANCMNADFKLAKGKVATVIEAVPCLFGVDFSYANLTNADFRGANVSGAIFKGAIMTNTRLLFSQKDSLLFSEKQINEIKWVRQ